MLVRAFSLFQLIANSPSGSTDLVLYHVCSLQYPFILCIYQALEHTTLQINDPSYIFLLPLEPLLIAEPKSWRRAFHSACCHMTCVSAQSLQLESTLNIFGITLLLQQLH